MLGARNRAHSGEKIYIVRAYFHVYSLVSIDTFTLTLKTFHGILFSKCHNIEGIADTSARVSWHFITLS